MADIVGCFNTVQIYLFNYSNPQYKKYKYKCQIDTEITEYKVLIVHHVKLHGKERGTSSKLILCPFAK